MSDDRTITKTRTTTEVKEIEETYHLCRNCDMEYDEEEMVTVRMVTDGPHSEQRLLCQSCAETVLGYEEIDTFRGFIEHRTRHWDLGELLDNHTPSLLRLTIAGALVATVTAYVVPAMQKMGEAVTVESEPQTQAETANMVSEMFGILPDVVFFTLLIVFTIAWVRAVSQVV